MATAYRERGDAHHQLGDDDGANADYDAALAADPNYDLAFISRANVAAEVGLYDSAVTDYTSAIKLDRRAAVFRSRGRAYALEYAYTEALSDFTTLHRDRP